MTKEALKRQSRRKKTSGASFPEAAVWKRIQGTAIEKQEPIVVDGKEILLINYDQEYWPGITKLQLILYYQSIASYILPYLKYRPLGLNIIRRWAGEQEARFLRNMKGNYPPWVTIFTTDRKTPVAGKSDRIDWVVCEDLATLIYLLNLGAVDLHPWSAGVARPNEPDYIVIDLDPDEDPGKNRSAHLSAFRKVIRVAQAAKTFFDEQNLVSFVKTSGKTGMHLLLPCRGIRYGATRIIAELLCRQIHERVPSLSTISTSTHSRGGKVYVDASQNDYGDRLAAPYCVRAYKQPYVSTPLSWDEVNTDLDRRLFRMDTILRRLEARGDLFEGLFDRHTQADNARILKRWLRQEGSQ